MDIVVGDSFIVTSRLLGIGAEHTQQSKGYAEYPISQNQLQDAML
ncbi:hypothetical protein OK016_27600 [Vibrio chagasii]|nr:hypothetical protein [Vibrio chagasii]